MSTILIVDDEESILDITAAILERHGYSTVRAENADEAEKALDAGKIDAVMVDIVLPGRGGLDLLMGIKERNAHIPVIVMSGKIQTDTEPFKKLATQFGAKCILSKPFNGQELVSAVKAVLNNSCA